MGRVGAIAAFGVAMAYGCSSADGRPSGFAPGEAPVDLAARLPEVTGWRLPEASTPAQPPIAGGTLLLSRDGLTAVVADPDEPRVLLVDLAAGAVRRAVALEPGDEPGRIAEDDAGEVHVVLRGARAILSLGLTGEAPPRRRPVCDEPRGIAWDGAFRRLRIACAEGTLVSLPASGDGPTERVFVDTDLRDVVVLPGRLVVSRFRSADILTLDRAGTITGRVPGSGRRFVAWRMTAFNEDQVMLLHQQESPAAVRAAAGSYNYQRTTRGPRGAAVVGVSESVLSLVSTRPRDVAQPGQPEATEPARPVLTSQVVDANLTVDVAVSPDHARVLLAIPGNWRSGPPSRVAAVSPDGASLPAFIEGDGVWSPRLWEAPEGQVTAAAFDLAGHPVVQTRSPATLVLGSPLRVIPLGGNAVADTGQMMFHTNPTGAITCATCHPEGGDDGHVWNLPLIGRRRTPPLRGGLAQTAPFHWDGDLRDLSELVLQVLIRRMGASVPSPAQVTAMGRWMDHLRPLVAAVPDPAAAARGRGLFESPDVGCAGCHSGPLLTNNETMDVGTGGAFQVPSLRGLRWHAPYLHDGRAATLADRFDATGGGESHGKTAALTEAERADLIAYLESL
jgi:hypothetical protein